MSSATPIPLRRDPGHGYVAGVCSGFAARLGIDPILIRIGFVLTLAAGGVGIPLYIIGWAFIPAEGPERPVVSRLLNRRDTWLVAAGMGCLTLSAVLLLRNWGLWFGDRITWPQNAVPTAPGLPVPFAAMKASGETYTPMVTGLANRRP